MKKSTILKSLAKELLKLIKAQSRNDWITPDDKRYTKILDKYSKQLSKHWKKTRDIYLSKIKTKGLELDDTVEDYDISPESSTYIDEALAILAFAFGQGVIVGYDEINSRDMTVDIPDVPEDLFEEASEIYNYAHSALTYEEQQMDEIYNTNKSDENAKQKIKDWFDSNEPRLTARVLGGLVWYSIQYGFSRAAIEVGGATTFLYWSTERDKSVCGDCKELEDNNPYNKENPLRTLPGGGKTICGSSCRCLIDVRQE